MASKNKNMNVRLLLDDYAGQISELTAITQYLHHHLVVRNTDIASLLEQISLDEMRHLESLGEALKENGINPRFRNSDRHYWSGDWVNYQYEINDILKVNIAGELDAISQYYKHIEAIDDKKVRKLLRNIVSDEVRHIQLLREKLETYSEGSDCNEWLKARIDKARLTSKVKTRLISFLKLD